MVEIKESREAKERVTASLKGLAAKTWPAMPAGVGDYLGAVCSRPLDHNVWEQLAAERFLNLAGRYGINMGMVKRFFAFYEALYFPGRNGMTRYKLTPVQAFQFANIFGFWDGGKRVTREACLFVPRKFSKTTSTASLAIWDLLFGEANAEAYTGANSADQAKKCFDVVRGCVRKLDPMERRYVINEQMIKSRRADRQAIAQCLTANARTKDGLNASTVIMDEFAQARDNRLLSVLTTSMGARANPLTAIITTASDVLDGPFYGMLDGYKRLLLGEYEDDSVFAHLFEPDPGDNEGSPATWRKVHPHIGVTVSEDFYAREWAAARRGGAEAMLAFRTKLLNVYSVAENQTWLTSELARKVSTRFRLDELQGRPRAMVAFDLAISDDFTAVCTGVRDGGKYKFSVAYFFPEGALPGHRNERLYRQWAAEGWLTLTPGAALDYQAVVNHILDVNRHAQVLRIGYDDYKAKDVVNMLKAHGAGAILTVVKQTYGAFTSPVQTFEHEVKTGKIEIDENPINAFCFGNAVLDFDKLNNCKPVKRRAELKIDGLITMLMCLRLFSDFRR